MKYIAVIHNYWMGHKNWEIIEIDSNNKKDAKIKALAMCKEKENIFNYVDCVVFEIKTTCVKI